MTGHRDLVLGTAGHIDHGKTALVRALTGVDTDRLPAEKQRGITIDLGFATLDLGETHLALIDVPGHERFIRNMLAGATGLDLVLLVVAADDSVMPQTREHLEILDLLEVSRGLAVVTKADLAEPDWLELVRAELEETLAPTSLAGAGIVTVSAVSGEGLEELKQRLDLLLDATPGRRDLGRPRLPVDRVFTMSGFGTVVTGTLSEGSLAVGEELEAQPSGRRVRVRGLQQHNRKVERAEPGSRVAANLVGVEREELRRGDVLGRPGTLAVTRRVDASVRVLSDSPRPLRHGSQVLLHTGTAEVSARAIVLEADEVERGGRGWVQLYLAQPVAVRPGDRFVLRLPSPPATIGGGVMADVAPRRHPRHDAQVGGSLERRLAGDVLQEELRKYPRGVTEAALLKATVAEKADLGSLRVRRAGQWLFAPEAWEQLRERARRELEAYHRAHPLRPGMPREEMKSRLALAPAAFPAVLAALSEEGAVAEREGAVALPGHQADIDAGAAGPAARLLELLGRQPWAPTSLPEAMRETGASAELVRALAQRGELVRLSEEVAFTRAAYESAVELVRELVRERGSVTVASLRDRMGASRRPVLALLEHLDAQRVTRRLGDERVLR
jgi:selenocysteine-specific elongation factor